MEVLMTNGERDGPSPVARPVRRLAHVRAGAAAFAAMDDDPRGLSGCGGAAVLLGIGPPVSRVRFSIRALSATMRVLPDIDRAATSGLRTKGYKTPAASGKAITL